MRLWLLRGADRVWEDKETDCNYESLQGLIWSDLLSETHVGLWENIWETELDIFSLLCDSNDHRCGPQFYQIHASMFLFC